jgi:NAD(P)-dependent dehydrogenase (short-subunit alcohol dehydrogenase family)
MILSGKVALVTGAGRGLGWAHAHALAATGARVVVNDLGGSPNGEGMDAGPAHEVVNEITAAGGIAIANMADFSSWSEAGLLVEHTVESFGRLDILISNAGICRPTAFGRLSELDWDRLIDVNAKGTAARSSILLHRRARSHTRHSVSMGYPRRRCWLSLRSRRRNSPRLE